jgi:hypothetical protein
MQPTGTCSGPDAGGMVGGLGGLDIPIPDASPAFPTIFRSIVLTDVRIKLYTMDRERDRPIDANLPSGEICGIYR